MATLVGAGGLVGADHDGCAPFERLPYEFDVEFHHGGDLYSTVHMEGYAVFRFCTEIRTRVLEEEIRWESRGGHYALHLVGEDVDDVHTLRPGANTTRWYERASIWEIEAVGLARDLTPTLIVAEPAPSRDEASSARATMAGAWLRSAR